MKNNVYVDCNLPLIQLMIMLILYVVSRIGAYTVVTLLMRMILSHFNNNISPLKSIKTNEILLCYTRTMLTSENSKLPFQCFTLFDRTR